MEVIHLAGYTEEEKEKISFQFLIPHQQEENGLKGYSLSFTQKRFTRSFENILGKQGFEI